MSRKKKVEQRVLCPECSLPIHHTEFGGADKDGFYHKTCIAAKIQRQNNGKTIDKP